MTPPLANPPTRSGDQLPRSAASSERNVGSGIAAVAGSLLLLVGVPVALLVLVGNPLPTTSPSRDWLTATIDADLIIDVLAVLVWVVWVHFVVCFLSEWRAIRRGRMPDHVVLGGGSQLLARRLVAGLLMLSGGIGIAQGLATTVAPTPGEGNLATTIAQVVQRDGDLHGVRATAELAADTARAAEVAAPGAVGGAKHYEVVPPQGRHHDTLWDISQRLLGDPLRYKEIYQLNKDRMQPDGRRLTDADLIQPGWQLLLPADAKGPGVRTAPASAITPTPAPTVAPDTRLAAQDVAAPTSDTAGDTATEAAGVDLGDLLLGGGLVLAGVVTALTARRGLFGTPGDQEGALRLAADPVRSDLLDRALRVLAEVRTGQNLPMPDISVVYLSDDKVIAHVVGSPAAPAHPWRAADDGASWSVTAADLATTAGNAPAPYPALVNVAESHGYDVLVDLEYASGLVAVGGDLALAREVVMSSVVDLATHAWSDSVEVTMVGFGDELAELAPGRIRVVGDVDTALDEIERGIGAASQLLARLGVDGVLSGRATARHDELKPRVLVLSAAPTSVQLQRISSLSGTARTAFAAISVGDALGARWRFVVDQTGTVDLGVLGVAGTARRFTLGANQELRALVQELVKESADRGALVAHSAPSSFVSPDLGPRAVREQLPTAESAAIRVQLLGPVAVTSAATGRGPARDIVSELVVMAVLHPHGLHEAVIRSSLWPRGVTDDVVESTLRDTQIWLGVDTTGTPRFAQGDDGLWHLGADVYVDWVALQASALPDGGSEAAAYLRGLQLAQGEAFSGTPAGRYSWLAWHRSARDARALAVTMASRAATLLAADPRWAEQALRAGLLLVPSSESLWRDLIRLHGDDRPHGPAGIVAELRAALPGQAFEAETEALVAHLAPGEALGRTS